MLPPGLSDRSHLRAHERRDLTEWRAVADELNAEFRVFSWGGYSPRMTGVLHEHEYNVTWGARGKTSTQITYHVSVNNPWLPEFTIVPTGVTPPLRGGRRQKTGDLTVDKAIKLYSDDDRVLIYITPPVLDAARHLLGISVNARLTNTYLEVADPKADTAAMGQRLRELVGVAASISIVTGTGAGGTVRGSGITRSQRG